MTAFGGEKDWNNLWAEYENVSARKSYKARCHFQKSTLKFATQQTALSLVWIYELVQKFDFYIKIDQNRQNIFAFVIAEKNLNYVYPISTALKRSCVGPQPM